MVLEKSEVIIGSLRSHFHKNTLCLTQTSRGHYYITYREYELDIGEHSLDGGLMKALKWFGEIILNERRKAE